jgi:hypothetical protein
MHILASSGLPDAPLLLLEVQRKPAKPGISQGYRMDIEVRALSSGRATPSALWPDPALGLHLPALTAPA